MFKHDKLEIALKGGEGKMRKNIVFILLFTAVLAVVGSNYCFAQVTTRNVLVTANVPTMSDGLDVGISKVNASGTCASGDDVWTGGQSSISFDPLTWDTTNKIFRAASYVVVDVGVSDNTGSWGISHTRTDLKHASAADTLNQNVNVTFVKKMFTAPGVPSNETELAKVSYADSNSRSFTKAQLSTGDSQGWLRVYYGVATGDTTAGCTDASGVVPIGLDKRSGSYNGVVTLTLTP